MKKYENPCLDCGFYDEDYGCTCFSLDKWYNCPIEKLSDEELEKIFTEQEKKENKENEKR